MEKILVYQITIQDYHVKTKPNHEKIGSKIDRVIKRHFLNKKVAIRCLGSQEHPGKTVEGLIRIIKKLGTDRYDPYRKGDRYENRGNKRIDFFAVDFKITKKGDYLKHFIEPFYSYPRTIGAKPVRLDIAIIYDRAKLKRIVHKYEGRKGIKRDGFVFKNPNNKKDAVLGIIKIL